MSEDIKFTGRVAIVTGAGGGLGRSHCLLLAARGAAVVVNDVGTITGPDGQKMAAADAVVREICAAGGRAVASHEPVENGDRVVSRALEAFGRVDILINNAGILRDVSFRKMTDSDWDAVHRVHLFGSYKMTHAAWPHMCEQRFGRIVLTSSASGLYGNFGQANYASAKAAMLGLSRALAIEGRKYGITSNTIAPIAGSKMTETILPRNVVAAMSPDAVSPLVAYLAHERCAATGELFEVGMGWIAKVRWQRSYGVTFGIDGHTPEDVEARWGEINDFSRAEHPTELRQTFEKTLGNLPPELKQLIPTGFI